MIDKELLGDASAMVACVSVGMFVATAAGVLGGMVTFFTLMLGYVAAFKRWHD